jgi:hypothetical protein
MMIGNGGRLLDCGLTTDSQHLQADQACHEVGIGLVGCRWCGTCVAGKSLDSLEKSPPDSVSLEKSEEQDFENQ